jgi:hypothetical protein
MLLAFASYFISDCLWSAFFTLKRQKPSHDVKVAVHGEGFTAERESQSHVTTDGQSVSPSWCRAPSGAHDQILITVWHLLFWRCRAPSLTTRIIVTHNRMQNIKVMGSLKEIYPRNGPQRKYHLGTDPKENTTPLLSLTRNRSLPTDLELTKKKTPPLHSNSPPSPSNTHTKVQSQPVSLLYISIYLISMWLNFYIIFIQD